MDTDLKYRHLFQTSPYSIMILDMRGIIRDCNASTLKMLGYTRNELIGTHRLKLNKDQKGRIPILRKRVKKLLKGEDPGSDEHQLITKDGKDIWVRSLTSLMSLEEGQFIQIISEDITEKKQAEKLIGLEYEKLKELDQIKKDLINRASHELKTPLISIHGGVEIIKTLYEDELRKEVVDYLNIIEKGYLRLNNLFSNLIDSLKFGSIEIRLDLQPMDLGKITWDCIEELRAIYPSKHIQLKNRLRSKDTIFGDAHRIEQVIINLLSNAIKNTPTRDGIYIGLTENEKSVQFCVKDEGIGLTKRELERLFTKFGKFERTSLDISKKELRGISTEGSGLGLFISKKIIEIHNGKLWARSEGRNKGAQFCFTLPKVCY